MTIQPNSRRGNPVGPAWVRGRVGEAGARPYSTNITSISLGCGLGEKAAQGRQASQSTATPLKILVASLDPWMPCFWLFWHLPDGSGQGPLRSLMAFVTSDLFAVFTYWVKGGFLSSREKNHCWGKSPWFTTSLRVPSDNRRFKPQVVVEEAQCLLCGLRG